MPGVVDLGLPQLKKGVTVEVEEGHVIPPAGPNSAATKNNHILTLEAVQVAVQEVEGET